jgi:hypothetical protein
MFDMIATPAAQKTEGLPDRSFIPPDEFLKESPPG